MQQIAPAFSVSLPDKISRVQPDSQANFIAFQADKSDGSVYFSSFWPTKNKLLTSIGFPVYYRLVGCIDTNLLIQGYDQLDKPEEPTLFVYTSDYKLSWQKSATTLFNLYQNGLAEFAGCGPENKNEKLWYDFGKDIIVDSPPLVTLEAASSTLPNLYPEGSENFAIVKQFIYEQFNEQICSKAEYAAIFGKILISYYTEVGKLYEWHFVVFDEQGKLVHKNCPEKAESPDGSATFMIWNAYILTLPNQNTVVGYDLKAEGT